MLKYEDEEGMRHLVNDIQVLKTEQKYYAGILSHKYVCQAVLGTRIEGFVLLYYPGENTWNMVLAEEYLTDMFPRIRGN